MPSSTGYLIVVLFAAIVLFLGLWWMLVNGGEEAPWLPAGLAASVVLLVALSAREVVIRRAWTRYVLENGVSSHSAKNHSASGRQRRGFSASFHSAALRQIQKGSDAANVPGAHPEAHLDVIHLCQDFLTATDEALRSGRLGSEKGIALRASRERVRLVHRHHMLTWAREQALALTRDAQQRARMSDKIETANKALDCIDSALRLYPDETELNESKAAIRECMASVRVAHWVELAERSAFKGHNRRAIERYQDALFYLNDEHLKSEVRRAGVGKIESEISRLRAGLRRQVIREPDAKGGTKSG